VSGDPDRHLTSSRLVRRVLRARGGSIVVMHANGAGIRRARDLSLILDGLEREGYEFVTVGTMLDDCQARTTPPSG
jgi:peptidoglycan/xylan/chitin deacetylase (PgdA/CDA1 family)